MDERPEPERVEVELTTTGGSEHAAWRADGPVERSAADVEEVASTKSETDGTSGNGRRATVIGVAAGVVGLSFGWMLGGSSGSSNEASAPDEPAPTTATTEPDEVDDENGALTPLATVPPPTTTRPTTTTSTIAPPSTEAVALNEKLAGATFRIVGINRGTSTAEIDVAAGTMTTRLWPNLTDPFGTVIGDGWIVTTDPATGRTRLITADGVETFPDIGEAWTLLWVEGTDTFWRGVQTDFAAGYDRFELVDLAGEPIGPTIDALGTWPSGVDPAGGVLVIDQGQTYSLRPDGVDFVGPGELLGVSAEFAVLRTCDERLDCELLVVDRIDGGRSTLEVDHEGAPGRPWFLGPNTGSVAPDGGAASFVTATERGARLVVVEFTTGEVHELVADINGPSGVSWSPDGRFGVFVQGSTPQLFDRETGTVEPLGDDLGAWGSIEIRPPRP